MKRVRLFVLIEIATVACVIGGLVALSFAIY